VANGRFWTPKEDALVRRLYARDEAELRAALPHRSRAAIQCRASSLGAAKAPQWTAADDALLAQEWQNASAAWLTRRLGRTWSGVRNRAVALRLPLGVPRGCVSIEQARRQLGLSYGTVERAVAFAELKARRWYPGTGQPGHRRAHPKRWYDRDDLVEAVDRYFARMGVGAAAARWGVPFADMRAALAGAGLVPAAGRLTQAHKVPRADVDRVGEVAWPDRADAVLRRYARKAA
jgi:hypothetical protein